MLFDIKVDRKSDISSNFLSPLIILHFYDSFMITFQKLIIFEKNEHFQEEGRKRWNNFND